MDWRVILAILCILCLPAASAQSSSALANTSSTQFAAKATSIRTQLESIYRQMFKNFLQMIIHSFRNGSIVTNSSLEFSANGTIPTDTTLYTVCSKSFNYPYSG
ncbi:hypothetical protein PHYPO_G00163700 [Pangasianodon hypophthalmus]|uniref:SEA domain-containing protein n=1 Tax=Pangasianodon hypophthalmus TaxID=310915 RepID=A0A5N5JGI6_PANHP|nr:hypothetical protein PHYPO_G00163700 [Pangasianodon hypophthalmus]